ncbi:DUF2076 family protein, partial [Allomesorhizobium alhagi]
TGSKSWNSRRGRGSPPAACSPTYFRDSRPASRAPAMGPEEEQPRSRAGGGFLAGAAQTAMGVAGGVLLGNAIAGMFGGNQAQAAEPAETADNEAAPDEAGFDEGGDFGDIEF